MRTTRLGSTLALAALITAGLTNSPSHANTPDVTIVAVGDIAKYVNGPQTKTAALAAALKPNEVLLLGDLAYGSGKPAEFTTKFDPNWGKLVASKFPTIAVPGNHEYGKSTIANGYRIAAKKYHFPVTSRPGELPDLWSATRVGTWTVIGLDSEGLADSSTSTQLNAKGVREIKFLKTQLAANNGRPTIVMWHRPRFSSGPHGNQTDIGVTSLWKVASSDVDVKVALAGHDHTFESGRQNIPATSKVPAHTIVTLTIGSGGADLYKCSGPNCVRGSYGVAKLTLHSTTMDWKFIAISSTTKTGTILKTGTTH